MSILQKPTFRPTNSENRHHSNGNGHYPTSNPTADFDLQELWNLDISRQSPQTIEIAMSTFFNATHMVVFESGAESIIHQHSYHLRVRAKSSYSPFHIVTPFTDLRKALELTTSLYEGKYLNNLPPFQNLQPTTENFTVILAKQLQILADKLHIQIIELSLNESPTAGVTIQLPYL